MSSIAQLHHQRLVSIVVFLLGLHLHFESDSFLTIYTIKCYFHSVRLLYFRVTCTFVPRSAYLTYQRFLNTDLFVLCHAVFQYTVLAVYPLIQSPDPPPPRTVTWRSRQDTANVAPLLQALTYGDLALAVPEICCIMCTLCMLIVCWWFDGRAQ